MAGGDGGHGGGDVFGRAPAGQWGQSGSMAAIAASEIPCGLHRDFVVGPTDPGGISKPGWIRLYEPRKLNGPLKALICILAARPRIRRKIVDECVVVLCYGARKFERSSIESNS